jgi:transcriptional regulator with XRE-family HTH domain
VTIHLVCGYASTWCETIAGVAKEQDEGRGVDHVDANFAKNMVLLREQAEMSQADLVSALREHGWTNVHPTTISRIEKSERPVKLSEASHIAHVLRSSLPKMLVPVREFEIERQLEYDMLRVIRAYDDIGWKIYNFPTHLAALEKSWKMAVDIAAETNNAALRAKADDACFLLNLQPADDAVTAGKKALEDTDMNGRRSAYLERYGLRGYMPPTTEELRDEMRQDDPET